MFARLNLILKRIKKGLVDNIYIAHFFMSRYPPVRTENGDVVLKSLGELRESDFVNYPVWVLCHILDYDEPWYDKTDEETYRPWTGKVPVKPRFDFIGKTTFHFKDGTVYTGFTHICNNFDYSPVPFSLVMAILLNNDQQESFWSGGIERSEQKIREFYLRIGKTAEEIFPIQYSVNKELVKEPVVGEITGFMSCDNANIVYSKQ